MAGFFPFALLRVIARANLVQNGGFESATNGLYAAGPIGDGLTVTTGTIAIIEELKNTHSGNQFAALPVASTATA